MQADLTRSEHMFGKTGMEKLRDATVWVFGIGGVGSYVVEALARNGIGNIYLVDKNVIDPSNINRQAQATVKTVGMPKAEMMKKRVCEINPEINVVAINSTFSSATKDSFDIDNASYIVDALGKIEAKVELIELAFKKGKKIITGMSPSNRMQSEGLIIVDISNTLEDKDTMELYKEMTKRGINSLKIVYNPAPLVHTDLPCGIEVSASCSYVAPVEGFLIAGEVIREIINE